MTSISNNVRTNTVSALSTTPSTNNPNAILNRYQPTGASARTAGQDGLQPGVAASQRMATNDLPNLQKYKADFEAAGAKYGLPPALLAAIASRESRGGSALDSTGHGDHGNGFGLMQVDHRYHSTVGGPYSRENIDQGASILKGYVDDVKRMHPDWPPEEQLRGAVVAYNSGPGNVRTRAGMDGGTTGDDYSNDVWARAQTLAPSFGGTASTKGPGNSTPVNFPAWDGKFTTAPALADVAAGKTDLKIGHQGESVGQVQDTLIAQGFLKKEDVGNDRGYFGPKTRQAVSDFQRAKGLTPPPGREGAVGPTTLQLLQNGGKAPGTSTPTPTPAPAPKPADGFETNPGRWIPAPSTQEVLTGSRQLRQGMQGPAVAEMQKMLGVEADGKFGDDTKKAVAAFQKSAGLTPPPGLEGVVGKTTLEALKKQGASGAVLGNGITVNTNHPSLRTLANSPLNNGPTGYCVATTLDNMERLGVPNFEGGTSGDNNNPRGAMVRLLKTGNWESLPLPGSQPRTINSPYGTVTAQVVSADAYERMAKAGQIPSGSIIFQTRHGWDYSGGSSGNDMGIVRNGGRNTHNYATMEPIIYGDAKEVVLLVPKGSVQRN